VLTAACHEKGNEEEKSTAARQITTQEEAQADSAIALLAQTLKTALLEHMQSGGTAAAVDFCSAKAQALTADVNKKIAPLQIQRSSDRVRNSVNSADSLDLAALEFYALKARQQGEPYKQSLLQTVTTKKGVSFRYYKPIYTAGLCLNCHGAEADLDPQVKKLIAANYPMDRATGYAADELRAVFRVSIP
jgi:hypothetical protein